MIVAPCLFWHCFIGARQKSTFVYIIDPAPPAASIKCVLACSGDLGKTAGGEITGDRRKGQDNEEEGRGVCKLTDDEDDACTPHIVCAPGRGGAVALASCNDRARTSTLRDMFIGRVHNNIGNSPRMYFEMGAFASNVRAMRGGRPLQGLRRQPQRRGRGGRRGPGGERERGVGRRGRGTGECEGDEE